MVKAWMEPAAAAEVKGERLGRMMAASAMGDGKAEEATAVAGEAAEAVTCLADMGRTEACSAEAAAEEEEATEDVAVTVAAAAEHFRS